MPKAAKTTTAVRNVKIAVLGASGYTGAELVRLLLRHPRAEIAVLTADRRAGQANGMGKILMRGIARYQNTQLFHAASSSPNTRRTNSSNVSG